MAKILVIEDEYSLRNDIVDILTFEGHEVQSASDGIEGVNTAIQYQPDLIVCDIMMPRLDGYRVLLDVRANSLTQFTPFIFLTAKTAQEDMRQGMRLGADDYIAKPFKTVDLVHAVQTRLEMQAAHEAEYQERIDVFRSVLNYERQQRLFQEKLVAIFSDDLPRPLDRILTSSTLLRGYGSELKPAARDAHFDRIDTAVHQLQRVLDQVLLSAQIESGTLMVKPQPVNVEDVLTRTVEEFQAQYFETFRLLCSCRVHDSIQADERLLRHILAGVIEHTLRNTPSGSEVKIRLDGTPGQFVLHISAERVTPPQGAAIPMSTGTQVIQAVGGRVGVDVGLEIIAQIVEFYGGSLDVQEQDGAAITVTFPEL